MFSQQTLQASSQSLPPFPPQPGAPISPKKKMNRAYETSRKRPVKSQYLILYNFISAILWLAVFGRVILLLPILGYRNVYGGVGEFAKWTQTVAVLEVLHSALGMMETSCLIPSFLPLPPVWYNGKCAEG